VPIHVQCSDPDKLGSLVDLVHDQWFDLEQITYDPVRGEVAIPFAYRGVEDARADRKHLIPRMRVPVYQAMLRVRNVTALEIKDTERIGTYEFNTVSYELNGILRIHGTIPLEVVMHVTELDASVEITDQVIRVEESASPMGCFWYFLSKG
jgi:hypothetical protein